MYEGICNIYMKKISFVNVTPFNALCKQPETIYEYLQMNL
jgi:hypothetical protein